MHYSLFANLDQKFWPRFWGQ